MVIRITGNMLVVIMIIWKPVGGYNDKWKSAGGYSKNLLVVIMIIWKSVGSYSIKISWWL